jgi:glycosyltransferase involved in cell wall biosynthesis
MERKVILHIVTSLYAGGAQMMLLKLLKTTDRYLFNPVVLSMMGENDLGKEIEALDIPVVTMEMTQGKPTPTSFFRLVKLVREIQPDLISGWMYHGNVAATISAKFLKKDVPVLWNIRQAVYGFSEEKWLTAFLIRFGAYFTNSTAAIIYNSIVSAQHHESYGYPKEKRVYIPNGFDTEIFRPRPASRPWLRKELGLDEDTILIGFIARYHPMKDHENFLKAASILQGRSDKVHFVLVGKDIVKENRELSDMIKELNLTKKVHLMGFRSDIPEITAGLDIATTSSFTESSPNVIGEAMASGVVCVATNLGDSAKLVGDTGKVVPPKDPAALARGWEEMIELLSKSKKGEIGKAVREQILEQFSITSVAERYKNIYLDHLKK